MKTPVAVLLALLLLYSVAVGQYCNLSNNAGQSVEPQLAVDKSGGIHVVWMDNTPGNREIFYARGSGVGWSSSYNISATPTDSKHPRMVVDSLGWVDVVWEEHLPSKVDIIHARFNILANTPIKKDTLTASLDSSSYSPDIAFVLNKPSVCWISKDGNLGKLYWSYFEPMQQVWFARALDDSVDISLCRITSGNYGSVIYLKMKKNWDGLCYVFGIYTRCPEFGVIADTVHDHYYQIFNSRANFEVVTEPSATRSEKLNACGQLISSDVLHLIFHGPHFTACACDYDISYIKHDGTAWGNWKVLAHDDREFIQWGKVSLASLNSRFIVAAYGKWEPTAIPELYRSTLLTKIFDGASWRNYSFFPDSNYMAPALAFDTNGSLHAAFCSYTYWQIGVDVFVYPEKITGIKDTEGKHGPASVQLFQNYPNPFNAETVIEYWIPVSGRVQIEVIDLLGRQVATLVNDYREPGKYRVLFDASRCDPLGRPLPSGIYFCQMRANGRVETKKIAVIK